MPAHRVIGRVAIAAAAFAVPMTLGDAGVASGPEGGAVAAAATVASSSARCAAPVSTWTDGTLAAQLLMVLGSFTSMASLRPAASAGVGAIDFLGHPPAGSGPSISAGIGSLQRAAQGPGRVAPWMATTEEGGTVTRLADVIGPMPSARRLARQSTAQITSTAAHQGSLMHSLGLTMDVAPVLDTAPPTSTVAAEGTRSFSDTGHVAGSDGLAFARGMLDAGEVPVVKHFPGLGHANADTDTGPATAPPLPTLEKNDLIPFREAASAGLPVVMVGNQIVPDLTSGAPASLSPAAYHFLRRTVGFEGVSVTDALGAGAITATGDTESSAAVAAIGAGADMALVDNATWVAAHAALQHAISTGRLPTTLVQTDVRRILATKGVSTCPSVGMASAPTGKGYWEVTNGGSASSYGSAVIYGSMGGTALNAPIVGMAAAPTGKGYDEVASDGGIFTFGPGAHFYGSMGGTALNAPIVGMAAAPTGKGYYEVASDGGIFTFGPGAHFYGSMGGTALNAPIVGMAAAPTGKGYYEVASDGGIFTFGPGAHFYGSMGGTHLNAPIVGMAVAPTGKGYWEVASDGGIFTFGDAAFEGSGA